MVVSLFTNVPIELASDSVVRRWDFISRKIKTVRWIFDSFILNFLFFIFKSTLYKQIFETSMASLLSPIVTDMILQDLEIAIGRLPYRLLFYFWYVNDIILAAPSESVDDILEIFNFLNTKLQFTVEVGINNRVSFLDILLSWRWETCFWQAIFSSKFLNFNSYYPVCHKRGIYGFAKLSAYVILGFKITI